MTIGRMCLLCMMHQTVQLYTFQITWSMAMIFVYTQDGGFGPSFSYAWALFGTTFGECRAAKLSHTEIHAETSTSKVAEQGRLAKGASAKSWVGCLKMSWISEDFRRFPYFFSKTYGSRVPRCLQTLPFHGWQMLAARSSKIIQDRLIIFSRASCGICWAFPDFWSMAESSNEIHGLNMFKLQTGFRAGSDTEEEEEEHISVMLIMLYNPGNAAAPPSTPVSAYKPDWILT